MEVKARFYGKNVGIYDGDCLALELTDEEAEALRVSLYACTKAARERENERRAEAAKPKTVRVRIAVAVLPTGEWSACGDSDPEAAHDIEHSIEEGWSLVWVTADIPLPVTPVVEGTVSQ
jgi:hypothetical protein